MEECKCLILGLFWIFKFDFSFDEVEIEKKIWCSFIIFKGIIFRSNKCFYNEIIVFYVCNGF